jgi:hypothetical protein
MKRARVIGLCVIATFAISAISVASASAEAPEFGRCLEHAKGRFQDAGCTTAAKGRTGGFGWSSGAVARKFTAQQRAETRMELVLGAGHLQLLCRAESNTGEFTGTKTVVLTPLHFTGCEIAGGSCTSAAQPPGNIVTAAMRGELGIINKGEGIVRPQLGLKLEPSTGEVFAEFECFPALKYIVTRSVIGHFVPLNSMTTAPIFWTEGSDTKQYPEEFEGGPPTFLEGSLNGGLSERIGWVFSMTLATEEAIEASIVN